MTTPRKRVSAAINKKVVRRNLNTLRIVRLDSDTSRVAQSQWTNVKPLAIAEVFELLNRIEKYFERIELATAYSQCESTFDVETYGKPRRAELTHGSKRQETQNICI